MKDFIIDYIKNSVAIKDRIFSDNKLISDIESAANVIIEAYKNNNKVLTAGNGGSAADAQHIAAELVSKFMFDRPALNAIALTTNTSVLTAISNDYGYEQVFARQICAHGTKGDVFIAISTSGKSANIIKAIEEAKNIGLKVVGLTGANNSPMDNLCDLLIKVPSDKTPHIQEAHVMIGHIICALVEKELF